MLIIVLLCLSALAVAAAWSARRHRQTTSWDRELEAAFAPGERRDLSHRVL
jgi:hypothetical protein